MTRGRGYEGGREDVGVSAWWDSRPGGLGDCFNVQAVVVDDRCGVENIRLLARRWARGRFLMFAGRRYNQGASSGSDKKRSIGRRSLYLDS